MRQVFFDTVLEEPDLEKYLSYYRWVDSSLSKMVRTLVPITADTSDNINNVIESHILERNHYRYNYPLLTYRGKTIEGNVYGISELLYPWSRGNHPISNLEADNCYWWNRRAERNNPVITSGNSIIDTQRDTIRRVATSHISGSGPRS